MASIFNSSLRLHRLDKPLVTTTHMPRSEFLAKAALGLNLNPIRDGYQCFFGVCNGGHVWLLLTGQSSSTRTMRLNRFNPRLHNVPVSCMKFSSCATSGAFHRGVPAGNSTDSNDKTNKQTRNSWTENVEQSPQNVQIEDGAGVPLRPLICLPSRVSSER